MTEGQYRVWDSDEDDTEMRTTKTVSAYDHCAAAEEVAEDWHAECDYFTEKQFTVESWDGQLEHIDVSVEMHAFFSGRIPK